MRRFLVVCVALSLLPALAGAQDRPRSTSSKPRVDATAPDPFARGRVTGRVIVGEPAPDFELTSSEGRDIALSHMRGDWLLLRFASDREELAALGPLKSQLDMLGVRMVAISSDKPQTLRSLIQRQSLPFEILSDATGEVAAVYGFYDPNTLASSTGMVIVDRRGIVRMALQGAAPPEQVVELAKFALATAAR